jgi:hypothetical protein
MAKALGSAWKSAANASLNKHLGKVRGTPASVDAFLKRIGIDLRNPLTKKQAEQLKARLDAIWKTSKRIAAKEAKVKVSFSQVDDIAVSALSRHQVFWVGDFYSEQMAARMQAVSREVMLEQGLSDKEAGRVLGRALRKEFGIIPGGRSAFAKGIPARYAGNPDLYFRQLAGTMSHQARTFAKLQQFTEAEVVKYKLINPNDERTGRICQQMHGQVFQVQVGVKHMQRILAAKKPADVKRIAPWQSGEEIEQTVGNAKRGGATAADRLARSGAILPPFHSLCRTEPVIVT